MCYYMQQINKINQPFPEILALFYFERWARLGMPDHTQKILYDLSNYMQKTNILQIVFEILKFKESCDLIGGGRFAL